MPSHWRQDPPLPDGHPDPFDDAIAQRIVDNADFARSRFVQTRVTKAAYTFVDQQFPSGRWRLCVVGHAHLDQYNNWVSGHAYIPGWADWQTMLSERDRQVLEYEPNRGQFPDIRDPVRLGD